MWKLKTDCLGKNSTAVKRRLNKLYGTTSKILVPLEVDLNSPTSRSEIGYNYLVWKAD